MKKIADLTDEELISMIKNGNDLAESEIFNRYKDLVTKICRGYFIVGGDLEDLVQEGMIGLYKAIKGYSGHKETSFKTFAIICIKQQRKFEKICELRLIVQLYFCTSYQLNAKK